MAHIRWKKHTLLFREPGGTSRGILHEKPSWFLLWEDPDFLYPAMGECSIIPDLSPDPPHLIERKLDEICRHLGGGDTAPDLRGFPTLAFGLEILRKDVEAKGSKELFPGPFTRGEKGIPINGLIWMGAIDSMKAQVRAKVKQGFSCLKLKVGAIDFGEELHLLQWIRHEFRNDNLELRVDANGGFTPASALEKLKRLSDCALHSIEQPIRAGSWQEMAALCEKTPLPIALDEELIGLFGDQKTEALDVIKPQYIILKPSLAGGWEATDEWIAAAKARNIGWWVTSALESNIGLNAITQYTDTKNVTLPQGLGTGGLYTNNVDSPLYIQGRFLNWDQTKNWTLKPLLDE